jgi:hypothetical protein
VRLVRENDTISYDEVRIANLVRSHHLAKAMADAGRKRSTLRLRARCALAVARWSTTASLSAGAWVRTVGRACLGTTMRPETGTGAGSACGQRLRGLVGLPGGLNREPAGL